MKTDGTDGGDCITSCANAVGKYAPIINQLNGPILTNKGSAKTTNGLKSFQTNEWHEMT